MHQIQAESQREYYEEMIRQAKITASAQSEDSSGLGNMTTGSGYSELVALRELDSGQGTSTPEANGKPAVAERETKIDEPMEGVAIVGGGEFQEPSSEMKLLREESVQSEGASGVASRPMVNGGLVNPVTNAAEEEGLYPDTTSPAPYLVSTSWLYMCRDFLGCSYRHDNFTR